MILLLSGEGPTDLGRCKQEQDFCEGNAFEVGPMTVIVDRIIEEKMSFSPLAYQTIQFIPKSALVEWYKTQPRPRLNAARGLKTEVETGYFFHNARALGLKAVEEQQKDLTTPVVAVIFRDADGTCSAPRQLWQTKYKSMQDGFASVPFLRGIPMLPRPKSEAWLLCAIKDPAYQHCQQLEELSGNDNAPNSIKDQLEHTLSEPPSRATLVQWIENNGFNWEAVSEQMPSFQSFTIRLNEILDQIIRPSREGSAQ